MLDLRLVGLPCSSPSEFKDLISWPNFTILKISRFDDTPASTDYGRPMKPLLKSRTFGLGQTNWADKFWDIWGVFRQTIVP